MPHNSREYDFIARDIFLPRNFLSWRYQLAAKIVRFDTIYTDKPSTLEHLKTNIRQAKAEIPPNMHQKVVEN